MLNQSKIMFDNISSAGESMRISYADVTKRLQENSVELVKNINDKTNGIKDSIKDQTASIIKRQEKIDFERKERTSYYLA